MSQKGSNNPAWKGGETRSDGYEYRYQLEYPRAKHRGVYVKRAVLVTEKELGRFLEPGEVVHHINGIRDDDSPENLQVVTKSEHMSLHNTGSANPSYREDLDTDFIREEYRSGATYEELEIKYKCSQSAIRNRIPAGERRRREESRKKDLDTDLIRKEYRSGASSVELAVKYGCSSPTIMKYIPAEERRKGAPKKKDLDIEEAKRLRGQGYSYQKIAEVFGVSVGTIWNRLLA